MITDTPTIISALRILANDIQSEDGVANACIAQAADHMAMLEALAKNGDSVMETNRLLSARLKQLQKAAYNLLELKKHKEAHGADDYYQNKKQTAWDALEATLEGKEPNQ